MNPNSTIYGQYNPNGCCGADCFKYEEGNPNNCAGDVEVIDEIYTHDEYWWVHACQVHKDMWPG